MESRAGHSFWDWRERLRERMQGAGPGCAADPAEDYQADKGPVPLTERLIQTIWAQQLLHGGGLRLADGRTLRVLDPGRWNGSAGPDFKGASLIVGADAVHGDVEVHLEGPEWLAHGHQRDLAYNTVVLHVVLRLGDGKAADPLHNGAEIPRLELEPYIFPDLETLRRSLTPDDYQYTQPAGVGRCHTIMTEMDPARVADFLDHAGDERLAAKTARLEEQARFADLEQVFYQAMMMALGAGSGKTLYYLLAKRTPLAEMMDYVRDLEEAEWAPGLEALLLHVGGLVPPPEVEQTEIEVTDEESPSSSPHEISNLKSQISKPDSPPAESRERAERLRALWGRFEPYWSDRVIPPTRRWYQGIRPVNFPVRRLAGMAAILARAMRTGKLPLADLLAHLRAGGASLAGAAPARRRHPLLAELVEWFTVRGEGHFWGNHFSFAARPSARVMDLIGEGAALSLVLNALLPAALLAAHREGDEALAEAVRKLYGLVPPLQPNHITEFMTVRLFGNDERAGKIINTERRRQALFQIFYACCQGEERHCESCYYLPRGSGRNEA